MDHRGLEPYRDSVDMARNELVDALVNGGTTPDRARRLIDDLTDAVRDLTVCEAGDATEADLTALAPRLGIPTDDLVGMADRARWRDGEYLDTYTVSARAEAN